MFFCKHNNKIDIQKKYLSMNILTLFIDAHGLAGGIAQYNRDFFEAAAELNWTYRIDVLARIGDTTSLRCNPKIHIHFPEKGRATYNLKAIRHSDVIDQA